MNTWKEKIRSVLVLWFVLVAPATSDPARDAIEGLDQAWTRAVNSLY